MKKIASCALAIGVLGAAVVMADDAAEFMKNTYPAQAVDAAVADMMALQGEDAALSAKTRELVSLAVSAQVPCDYCVYFHTKAAKAAGATDAEVKEAVAAAGQVRKWSTILNGTAYDHEAFRKEVDAMFPGK